MSTSTATKPSQTEKTPTAAEAKEIAQRFINAAFKRPGVPMPRVSIPCEPNKDDDCQLLRFIDNAEKREQELLGRIQMLESSVAIYRRSEMPEVKQAAEATPAKAVAAEPAASSQPDLKPFPTHAVIDDYSGAIIAVGTEEQCKQRHDFECHTVRRLAPPPPQRMSNEMREFVRAIVNVSGYGNVIAAGKALLFADGGVQ